ncbi:membrane protein [Polaribacter pacificus]|uniref:Membrane protein n=1 Tax=Polaribacter pacificus TaxID=1775173 RepID=A0A917MDF6_9FLAO|nr:DUF456 domain-containing protein [Polaribacter pacificus]GGG90350.1 membrane protein [Polaribacter pacificus]
MDILLLSIGLLCIFLGIVGAFLPVLPGPLTSWVGFLFLHYTKAVPADYTFLSITFAIALFVYIIDYFIPAMGAKKFGGSKYGIYGTTIGLLIGLFIPIPFGIIIGAFLGAFIGEIIHDSTDTNRAMKASLGSLLGFLVSTGIKFGVGLAFAWLYIDTVWEYKSAFF